MHKLAAELEADEEELLLLANKVPEPIRKRVVERPDVFRVLAGMNDKEMDMFLEQFGKKA
ncbi:MAG TPA: hypothetical protein DD473_02625 [Planctomycetaceae bacterium]|nr:hypothetical protein [Planctomycetaceae bacterium]